MRSVASRPSVGVSLVHACSAIEANAVKVREGGGDTTLVQDDRLRWPDTFSEGPDGTIYVTSSRIQDMSWFKPESGPRLETQLWRIEPGQNGEATGSTGQPKRP